MKTIANRIYTSSLTGIKKSKKTIWWLLKIIIPISLIVSLLQYWGIISIFANFLKPVFTILGLPGEAAIVFISSIFLPLYGPIAIISTLPLSLRDITILAFMCLVSHNLIVETAIQKKTGSSAIIMFFLRLSVSIIGAFILNLLLPAHLGVNHVLQTNVEFLNIGDLLINWIKNSAYLSLKIALIISGLMILQSLLKEFKLLDLISKSFAPIMKIMGLSEESSFLWFVAQTLGLAYGSAVMIEEVENNEISHYNANLLNYHIAVNHSLLEDTLLFVSIGVPAGWIITPRFLFAIGIVWSVRFLTKKHKNN